MLVTKTKLKKCKSCSLPYMQWSSTQVVCSPGCAMTYNAEKMRRQARHETVVAKANLKTLTEWLNDAQRWFNKYVRLLEADMPCVSCGTLKTTVQYHAGHYRTTKSAPQLRFNLDNVHKQCATCNNHHSGNIISYRPSLLQLIGKDRLEALENNHELHRYTIEEAKAVLLKYKILHRDLTKEREHG